MVKRSGRRPRLVVSADGGNVVDHAGSRVLCDLADAVGLTDGLSAAMAPTKQRRRGHDRGEVLADLAVMIADGGEAISDLAVLRDQPELFGTVASNPTAWRTLEAVDDAALERIAAARAQARAEVWAAGGEPELVVVDIDGTLIDAHSEKEDAAPTYKRGFGFHPLLAYLDATGEALAGLLRPGNAGSNTAEDHIVVLDAALGQLPVDPARREVIVRADTAALTYEFIGHCRQRQARFVVGHALTQNLAKVLVALPEQAWVPAISADGTEQRPHAEVTEITDLVDLSGWPEGTRMIARREDPHPGAQLTFTDVDGHRFQLVLTDLDDPDIAYLEALYRGRGRAEKNICDGKDTGLANLPSESFAINKAWLSLALMAHDLLAWTKLVGVDDQLARAEPKRLRYCLLHTAGVIARSGRRTRLRLAETWPWAQQLAGAFTRVRSLPLRC